MYLMDKKIVIATPLYPPDIGGPATDSFALAEQLRAQGKRVEVYAFGQVRHLPRLFRHSVYGFQLFRAARGAGCITAFDTVSVGVPAAFVAFLRRVPLVVRVPGDYAWEQGTQRFGVSDSIDDFQQKYYGVRVGLLRLAQRFTVCRAALVVAPSDYFKGIVAQWGVSPQKLTRIYLGIDMSEKPADIEAAPNGKILFSAGRFVPWKGFGMLIQLLAELPQEWHLVLAGDGPLRAELGLLTKQHGVAQRVTFLGSVSRPQMYGWLKRADAFALNTSFESFSFQVAEAMAMGAPVVATNIGSLPELVRNGVDGVLCRPDDMPAFKEAVLATQTELTLWRNRTASAQARAAEFSVTKSARLFADAIQTLCV